MSRRDSLTKKFRDKQYRDSYVAAHTKAFLAQQIRAMRGDKSQGEFAEELGLRQTQVSRLEDPNHSMTLKTILEIARKKDIAVVVRFVTFDKFIDMTDDMSEEAVNPESYKEKNQ